MSSPSASVLRPEPTPRARTAPTARNGTTSQMMLSSRPASEPTTQNRNSSRVETSRSRIADVNDDSRAATAVPARASFNGVDPR